MLKIRKPTWNYKYDVIVTTFHLTSINSILSSELFELFLSLRGRVYVIQMKQSNCAKKKTKTNIDLFSFIHSSIHLTLMKTNARASEKSKAKRCWNMYYIKNAPIMVYTLVSVVAQWKIQRKNLCHIHEST